MTKKLTTSKIRRRSFAEFVAQGLSATEAYKRAGYKSTGHAATVEASKLLTKPDVQEIISEASKKASEVRVFDAAARREILRKIAEGEVEQEIVTETEGAMGSSKSVQKRKPTSAERAAAIKHLDELDGLIRQKVEHSGPNGQPIGAVLATVDEATIRDRIAELAKRKPPTKGK